MQDRTATFHVYIPLPPDKVQQVSKDVKQAIRKLFNLYGGMSCAACVILSGHSSRGGSKDSREGGCPPFLNETLRAPTLTLLPLCMLEQKASNNFDLISYIGLLQESRSW